MKNLTVVLTLTISLISATLIAQIDNFSLTDVTNNKPVSLNDFSDKDAIVVIFTSNYCPFSKLYEQRIKGMSSMYDDVQFLLINSNNSRVSKYDTIEEMAKRAQENKYTFPYLADKDQTVSGLMKATKTPESFVLKKVGTKFNVIYKGAIDDNPQVAEDVSRHYLREAINAALSGNKTVENTRPTGCIIKR